ncbi:MAG: GNAT family N-acetyltransferase [Patescibacteria group bacterium]
MHDIPERHQSERREEGNVRDITVRNAVEQDKEFVRTTHHLAYYDVSVKQFGTWDDKLQDNFFNDIWSAPDLKIINFNDEPCGYYLAEELQSHIKLHELVILPEFQGKNIGSSILKQLQDQSSQQGIPITLQVLRDNRAIELYERSGFSIVSKSSTHNTMEWST